MQQNEANTTDIVGSIDQRGRPHTTFSDPFSYFQLEDRPTSTLYECRTDLRLNMMCNPALGAQGALPAPSTCYTSRVLSLFEISFTYAVLALLIVGLLAGRATRVFAVLGAVIVLGFLANNDPRMERVSLVFRYEELYGLLAAAVAVALAFTRAVHVPTSVLPREQLHEWHGWLMLVLLAGHYTDALQQRSSGFGTYQLTTMALSIYLVVSTVACSGRLLQINYPFSGGAVGSKIVIPTLVLSVCATFLVPIDDKAWELRATSLAFIIIASLIRRQYIQKMGSVPHWLFIVMLLVAITVFLVAQPVVFLSTSVIVLMIQVTHWYFHPVR